MSCQLGSGNIHVRVPEVPLVNHQQIAVIY